MSLKIKSDDVMWSPEEDDTYYYGELNCSLATGNYGFSSAIKVVFHPKWVNRMNELSVGDAVTDETGRVGIIVSEQERRPSVIELKDVKSFVVAFADVEEVCHSFVLHRVQEEA
jgi:hypothetical protein